MNPENFEKALQNGFDKAQNTTRNKKSMNPNPMKGRKFAPIGHPNTTAKN